MNLNLSVKNISWKPLNSNKQILKNISFDLQYGKILGIIGPNGAGKTSLLKLLYRYQKPTNGVIEINNSNLWTLSANEVASNIAVVLQEHISDFSLSVEEIIALGRIPHRSSFFKNSEKDDRIIQNVLRRFSLNEISDQKLSTLSGGEYQRVMIARAFVQEPRLLILDEPTNHLDIRHQLEVIKLIKGLSLSIIVTVHDLNVAASICDYILLLKKGRSLGFGKPEDILTENKISSAFNVKTQNEILFPSNCKQITFHI